MPVKYSKEALEEAVANSDSYAGVLRYLNLRPAGGTQSHLKSRISHFGIDTSHFTGQNHTKNRGKARSKKTADEILIVWPEGSPRVKTHYLVRALLEKNVEYVCVLCGLTDAWNGDKLTLEVDHIDGNYLDCRLENLRFLCPNCHSQQKHTSKPHKHAPMAKLVHAAVLEIVS